MSTSFSRTLAAAAFAAAALAACAHRAPSRAPSLAQNVSLSSSQRAAVLAQYDHQIAALRSTMHVAAFSDNARAIDSATASLRAEVAACAREIDAVLVRNAATDAARQDAAVGALLAQAVVTAPSSSDVERRIQGEYRREYADLRDGSQADMRAYQNALLAQQAREYDAFVRSVQTSVRRAYANRANELREQESSALLELQRRDAGTALLLRAKLETLAMSAPARAQIRARIESLRTRENLALAAQRARDAATLQSYRATLFARAAADVAATASDLQSTTQANLAARRDVLAAQRLRAGALPLPAAAGAASISSAELRASVQALRARGAGAFRADAAASVAAFANARDDIAARFAAVRDADSQASQATLAAIAQLERDRAQLLQR